MKKLKTLIFSMIKVGCMGFGGGNALIPVIEEEAVKDKKLVSCQEYDRTILAATLTPGALPVELAAGIGYAGRSRCTGTDPVCIGGSHGCDHVPFDPVYSGNLQKLLR